LLETTFTWTLPEDVEMLPGVKYSNFFSFYSDGNKVTGMPYCETLLEKYVIADQLLWGPACVFHAVAARSTGQN